ncbi:SGNH/GDSL hydrolase family protein [Nocardioides alcanivorans]|uniref:SGNH/GDSL hydrolase family protein n=1 Tax=Nocardioides alcanivorans TaxID=2897352 RepID=UPI001F342FA0|nr:SGNH/GDSL hydrolase family protein [Nocardioides alcanivorans]
MIPPIGVLTQRLPLWVWLPVIVAQGLKVRRTTPRLAEAREPRGVVGSGQPVRLMVVGDSLAAGVGVPGHAETVAGHLADLLATAGARVEWSVHARTGLAAGGVLELLHTVDLEAADVVLISVGVNDTKDLHTLARWRRELTSLLDHVLRDAPQAAVLLLDVPPMEQFPALPSPLAEIFGARAARLREVSAAVVAERPRVHRLWFDLPADVEAFASDGFHPGPAFHRVIAEEAATLLKDSLRAP